jgi:hypothetical protein
VRVHDRVRRLHGPRGHRLLGAQSAASGGGHLRLPVCLGGQGRQRFQQASPGGGRLLGAQAGKRAGQLVADGVVREGRADQLLEQG